MNTGLPERRFLITRLPPFKPHFYDTVLDWIGRNAPELMPLIDLQTVPFEIPANHDYGLHVPWIQDPVQSYNLEAYDASCKLSEQCDKLEIPVINRVEKVTNTGKVRGSELIRKAGFRTPRMELIESIEEFENTLLGFTFPFFIRDDWNHFSRFYMVESRDQVKGIPWEQYGRPVVCEFIDTKTKAGCYDRYRCFIAGDICVPQGRWSCEIWKVKSKRLITTIETREQDLEYALAPDPNADRFFKAAANLELQWLAFDYALDPVTDEVIVWEANPYPNIDSAKGERAYRRFIVDRIIAAMLRLYLKTAGLEVSRKIERLAQGD